MDVAPATLASPASPLPGDGILPVRPGVWYRTEHGHECATFAVVHGVPAYECAHHHVLRPDTVHAAFLRADGLR
jgi:hypothetical protein